MSQQLDSFSMVSIVVIVVAACAHHTLITETIFGQVMYVMAYYAHTYLKIYLNKIRYAVTNMQRLIEESRISVFSQVWEVDPWMAM